MTQEQFDLFTEDMPLENFYNLIQDLKGDTKVSIPFKLDCRVWYTLVALAYYNHNKSWKFKITELINFDAGNSPLYFQESVCRIMFDYDGKERNSKKPKFIDLSSRRLLQELGDNFTLKDILIRIKNKPVYQYNEIVLEGYKEKDSTSNSHGGNVMSVEEKIESLINNGVSQLILTGAPGTGKTFIAKKIANELAKQIEFVQFHPSFDYTDFVEGLRPVEIDGQVTFKKIDGIFKAFCRKIVADKNTDNKYFFIIDEINRADLSKVLGELMFGLEKDKRGQNNRIQTQYSNLPTWNIESNSILSDDCFKDGFYIPENVVVIGTMNDIDRSVESFDFALRRRFTWFEVEVTEDLLDQAFEAGKDTCYEFAKDSDIKDDMVEHILKLNEVISAKGVEFGLNKHYYISQGHFTNIPSDTACNSIAEYVWEYRLKSLIEEYVRGEHGASEFVETCEQCFLHDAYEIEETPEGNTDEQYD